MEIYNASTAFSALSQETRLQTLKQLIAAGPKGVPAGAIAQTLGLPAPTMSFHLKELANAGLILSRKEGRNVIYAADYGGIRELIDYLLADCCQGDRRLCGPYILEQPAQ